MLAGMHSAILSNRARGALVREHLLISIAVCAWMRVKVDFYACYPCGVRVVLHALIGTVLAKKKR